MDHVVCRYPVKSTWLKTIKVGNFHGWPLLNVKKVKKYYPETEETAKGHMNQTRKNMRSTKLKQTKFETADTAKVRGKKEHYVYIKVYKMRKTIYSNQIEPFTKILQSNNKCIMVMVEIDLKDAGVIPKKHVLDNKISDLVKDSFKDLNIEYQLVSPGMHHRNAAERAIQTFKIHFIAIIVGLDPNFPKHLWDTLLIQVEATLNML